MPPCFTIILQLFYANAMVRGTDAPMIFDEYENRETFVEKYKRRIIQNPFLSVGKTNKVCFIMKYLSCITVL